MNSGEAIPEEVEAQLEGLSLTDNEDFSAPSASEVLAEEGAGDDSLAGLGDALDGVDLGGVEPDVDNLGLDMELDGGAAAGLGGDADLDADLDLEGGGSGEDLSIDLGETLDEAMNKED